MTYSRPKATGERAFYDVHNPKTVDRRDHPGDNEHKASTKVYKRSADRYGYDPDGSDERAYFPSGPDQMTQGRPGLTQTSVPVVTSWAREHAEVNELHEALQRTARAYGTSAKVCSRQIGGFLASITAEAHHASVNTLQRIVAEVQQATGASVQLLEVQTCLDPDGPPQQHRVVGWVRMSRKIS